METQQFDEEQFWKKHQAAQTRGKIMGGLLLISIGTLYLLKLGGILLPDWIFTWKMLLIGLGLVFAVKHKFRHPAWIVLILTGGGFLAADLLPEMNLKAYLWPSLLILLGLFIVFKPRKPYHKWRHYRRCGGRHANKENWRTEFSTRESLVDSDEIHSSTYMGGVKKVIISKKFKGGNISNVFGGSEINFMQADMEAESATLQISQVFGGTKLIVPAHWEIRSELVTIMGSVEDNRSPVPVSPGQQKRTLILSGTTVMGGIEISTY
ncbi:MAG TPA: LiaF-related protein [Bacteroidia bacterium]|nr:LiaF-related protein [Bacteroidia bacterium]